MYYYDNYKSYYRKELEGLYISSGQVYKCIEQLDKKLFIVNMIGYSENKKPIYSIKFGTGKLRIIMWTQMHGDESTATKSVFDILNYFELYKDSKEVKKIKNECTLFIIPMLNPDGSDLYTRENALGNDINRDAQLRLNKESKILYEQILETKPDFAFNLHDQTAFYNVENSDKTATISLLAPAADEEKSITTSRKKAMSVIVDMHRILGKYIPEAIGRYNDDFCPKCFGDTFQAMEIPTILVECGYFPKDREREHTRKIHSLLLLETLFNITHYRVHEFELYFKIPKNEKKYYDFKIENVLYNSKSTSIGVRLKNIRVGEEWKTILDPTEEIIEENELGSFYFHNTLDAKNQEFELIVDKLIK